MNDAQTALGAIYRTVDYVNDELPADRQLIKGRRFRVVAAEREVNVADAVAVAVAVICGKGTLGQDASVRNEFWQLSFRVSSWPWHWRPPGSAWCQSRRRAARRRRERKA